MVSPNHSTLQVEAAYRNRLRESLQRGLNHFDPTDPAKAREGVLVAVNVMIDHLEKGLGIDRYFTRPIREVWNVFYEASRGLTHPLVQPLALENRPPLSLRRLELMREISLAMDLMMLAGKAKEDAAKYVAREMKRLGIPLKGKRDTPEWKIVAGWRDRLSRAGKRPDKVTEDWHFAGWTYLFKKESLLRRIKDEGKDSERLAKKTLKAIAHDFPSD